VERDPIFIKDEKFYTTAGVTAGIDLSLALVAEDLGHAVAASIARTMVIRGAVQRIWSRDSISGGTSL
jgi:transcriptional regulator GlxA family with amidase domain